MIAKPTLCAHVISVGAQGHRVIGIPTCLMGAKYFRNAFVFNVAVVVSESETSASASASASSGAAGGGVSDATTRFETALSTVSTALSELETSRGFLHQEEGRRSIEMFLPQLRETLNVLSGMRSGGERVLSIPGTETTVKIRVPPLPGHSAGGGGGGEKEEGEEDEETDGVLLWRQPGVPVTAVTELGREAAEMYEHIEGVCTAREAARAAGIVGEARRKSVAELLSRNLVVKADAFAQSYVATPRIRELAEGDGGGRVRAVRQRLMQRCFGRGAKFEDAMELIGELRPGTTAQDLINRSTFKERKVDDPRAFLSFCLAHGWIQPMPDVQAIKECALTVEAPNPAMHSHSVFRDPRAPQRHFV